MDFVKFENEGSPIYIVAEMVECISDGGRGDEGLSAVFLQGGLVVGVDGSVEESMRKIKAAP